jgi:hypothetical protein
MSRLFADGTSFGYSNQDTMQLQKQLSENVVLLGIDNDEFMSNAKCGAGNVNLCAGLVLLSDLSKNSGSPFNLQVTIL